MSIYKNIRISRNRLINKFIRQQHVAMFHIGRCGSTVLADLLNQHPNINWAGEVWNSFHQQGYNKEKGESFVKTQLNLAKNYKPSRIFGFETRYLPLQDIPLLINLELPVYVKILKSMGFEKFILLHRENYLKRAVSFALSKEKEIWHTKRDISVLTSIDIDPNYFPFDTGCNSLLDSCHCINNLHLQLKTIFKTEKLLELSYENDILKDPVIAYHKVCEFLQLRAKPSSTQLRRTNPFPLKKVLNNYTQIADILADSPFDWMISYE